MKILLLSAILTGGLFAHPYIYVSTWQIYRPGEPTEVRVEVSGIDEVHMRLYKIENPLEFFANQENLHSPRITEKAKPANFFHILEGLAQRPKLNTRYLARELMSEESRIAMRDFFVLPRLEKDSDPRTPERLGPSSIPRLKGYPLLREWTEKFEEKTTQDDYYYYNSSYHYEALDLNLEEPGVYLVEAYYGTRVAYTPVIVTEMTLVTKQDPGEVYVFALDSESGKPKSGAKIVVLADTLQVGSGRTNSKGIYHTDFSDTRLRVLAQDGDNFAIMDKYYYYQDEWGEGGMPSEGNVKIYLHTERPIYRPDQTVYFKGTLRRKKNDLYRTPGPENVDVAVTDPEGNEIYRRTLKTDDEGSLSDSLIVPSTARLGRYTLSATLDSTYHSVQFRVEEYRKPEFKVEAQTDKDAYVQGDEVKITVSADYFFGAPVSEGEVTLNVYRREYAGYWWYGTEYVDELTATTDEQGKTVFRYRTPRDGESYQYVFEVGVRDPSRRSESGEATAYVAESGVLVNIRPARYVVAPGEELKITVNTQDIFKKPLSATVNLVVYRNYWDKPDVVVSRKTLSTGSDGKADYEFTPKEAGSYYVQATTSDDAGNESSYENWFYASERGGYYSWQTDEFQIIFDKESYDVGDRAEALVISPYENVNIIAALEADRLYKVDVVSLKGSTALLRFKVRKAYVPNVYLSVSGISQGEFFEHKEQMKVNRAEELLAVQITPDKERYQPGERATLDVLVTDAKGKPVKADLSLGVVDEAIYSLASEIAPAIEDYFYGERSDQVSTSSSTYFSFWGYEQDYRLSEAASDSVVLAAYKGREEPKVRERFKDVAYWNALVRTDGRGRAMVEFEWPDNLTTWRATARAISQDTKVGEGRSKVLVTKDLLLRIAPPRFVTERDSLVIPTVVHNYTTSPQTVQVTFSVQGLVLLDNTIHTSTIRPGASFRVDWPVRCETPGDVTLTAKAIAPAASDAMKLTIPANPHGIERNLVISAFMPKPDEQVTKKFTIPEEAELKTIKGKLTLTPTLGSALFAGLSYLAGYPYGCTEQTMSSFFPDLIVADIIRDPNKGDSALAAELPKMIEEGLAKLYGYQHSDGGWGWWTNDESMNFMTAYVVHGLIYAQELGYDINPNAISRGAAALEEFLKNRKDINATERAYMVYVLSMAPGERAQFLSGELKRLENNGLDSYSLALMALTYHEIGDAAKAKAILDKLKKESIADGEMVYWSGRTRAVEYWTDDAVEVTATTLRAFLAISPKDEIIPKIVYWLLRERRGNQWKSTKDSALALLALAEFLLTTKDESPEIELAFELNGRKLASYSITQKELLEFNRPLEVKLAGLSEGDNTLKVSKKGPGNLFFSMVITFYSKEEGIPEGGGELKVHRKYYRLIPRVENDQLVYDKVELEGPVRVGEPVFVKLFTDCEREFEYVMIKDPIPAGFEVAKENDRYRIRNESYWWGYYDYEDNWGYMYAGREIHDDHVAFFMSYLWEQRELTYVITPEVPGTYHVMPAEISLMYYPDKRGHSAEEIITVEE